MTASIQAAAKQGPKLSPLVYGLWRLGSDREGAEPARVMAKIETCLELGITTFDHADIYGDYTCEALFGRALALAPALRERMQLVSKCGIKLLSKGRPEHTVKHYDTSAEHILASVDRSLQALGTEWLDLLLIHRPDPLLDPDEVAGAFDRLHAQGKVRHFGVSNFAPSQFDALQSRLTLPLCTNQVELSLLRPGPLHDGTVDHCQRHNIAPMAWSPLGGGSLFTATDERSVRVRKALESVAQAVDASPDQVALAWLLRHPAEIRPVVGTNDLARIKSAAGALKVQLCRQQWFALWQASMGHAVP